MEGPRPPLENEFGKVVSFLDSHLRPNEGWSITSEYPIALSEGNRSNIRIITERDEVLSHAVVRPMIIKSPAGLFKVAGIGSVVTSNDHRNQGLSTKTIESCLDAARSHGCDFAILWTNLYDFYRRMGFELTGSEISALINQELNVPAGVSSGGLKILEGNRVAPEAIHRLYSNHTVTCLRNVDEIRKYLQIPNSRVYTAWDQQGQLKAYAIEGKGADLGGYIHEWGGGVSALLQLFAHIRREQKRPITVIIPSHSQNLIRALQEAKVTINEGYLGMIKLLNAPHVFAKINRYARNLGEANFILEKQDDVTVVGSLGQTYSLTSESDVVRLIFGPQKPSTIHRFAPETAAILDRVLPIPMWVWGWDSV